MPWHIETDREDCAGYGVVKDIDGALVGCHRTQAQAENQLAALYASEPDATRAEDMPQIIVADFDGTLVTSGRDPVRSVVDEIKASAYPLVILSGRDPAREEETRQVLENIGLRASRLILVGTQEAKTETMAELLADYEVVGVYENDAAVARAYEALGLNVIRIQHPMARTRRAQVEEMLTQLRANR